MELLGIHDDACAECRNIGRRSLEGSNELFFSKDWMTVLQVYSTIGFISLFKVDVPSSSQCVRFSTKFTGSEPNEQIKLLSGFLCCCLSFVLFNVRLSAYVISASVGYGSSRA